MNGNFAVYVISTSEARRNLDDGLAHILTIAKISPFGRNDNQIFVMNVQIIESNGQPVFAVLPYQTYLRLMEKLDEMEDRKAAKEISYRINQGEETFPAYVVKELLDSEHPIRVWRQYRGLTLQELADRVQISKSYLSQIESGSRPGSLATLKRIAHELELTLDDLV